MPATSNSAAKAYLIPFPVESFAQPIALVSATNTIGRDPKDTVCIIDKTVSRKHATINWEDGHYTLHDLDSQNGTFVNRKQVTEATLHHHDHITVGSKTFLFLLLANPEALSASDTMVQATATLSLSSVDIEPSEMLAQPASVAARGIYAQPVATEDTTDRSRQSLLRLSLIYQLSEQLRVAGSAEEVVQRGLALVMKAMETAERSAVLLKPAGNSPLELAGVEYRSKDIKDHTAIEMSRTILDWVLTEKMALVSQNVLDDDRLQASDSLRIQNRNSIICVPLIRGEAVFGVVYVDTGSVISPLTQEDAIFVAAVANELALTLENLQLQNEALRNERMAAIGLTVTNLAHNIKNMISLNQNAVDLMGLQLEKLGNPGLVKSWRLIHESFSRINHLSADMLNFAKDHKLDVTSVDIKRLLEGINRTLDAGLAHDKVDLRLDVAGNLPKWQMDATQLQRALLNLVVNAVDSLKKREDGRVVISANINHLGELAIQVADNGVGIKPEHLNRIFDLFYTTKGTGGSGLGLTMVQRFVEQMGGKVAIDSQPDRGTAVTLTFPIRSI